eukprot:scaffold692_cov326-Prasinococcus_capsulatus_cf.AAC.4
MAIGLAGGAARGVPSVQESRTQEHTCEGSQRPCAANVEPPNACTIYCAWLGVSHVEDKLVWEGRLPYHLDSLREPTVEFRAQAGFLVRHNEPHAAYALHDDITPLDPTFTQSVRRRRSGSHGQRLADRRRVRIPV